MKLNSFQHDAEVVVAPNRTVGNRDTEITVADFKRLINGERINDVVIYAFLNVLSMRTPDTIALYGTFFIDQLSDCCNKQGLSNSQLDIWLEVCWMPFAFTLH